MKKFYIFLLFLPAWVPSFGQKTKVDTLKTFILPNQYAVGAVFDAVNNEYIIATAGAYITSGDQAFLRYDLNWNLKGTFSQRNTTLLGFRDLTTDGNYIYSSYGSRINKIDMSNFITVDSFPGALGTCRGLAIDGDGTFWEANSNAEALTHCTKTQTVLGSCQVSTYTTEAPYGIAIDSLTVPGKKWLWFATHAPTTTGYYGIHLTRYDKDSCRIDTTYDITSKVPGYSGTNSSAGNPAGLHIIKNHPNYPGKIIALYVGRRNGGNSYLLLLDITPPVIVGTRETGQKDQFLVMPNPSKGDFRFQFPGSVSGNLMISDLSGRIIRDIQVTNTQEFCVYRQGLNAGMYIYQFKADNILYSGKLVIE